MGRLRGRVAVVLAAALGAVVAGGIVAVQSFPRSGEPTGSPPLASPPAHAPRPADRVLIFDYVAAPDTSPAAFEAKAASQLRDPLVYGVSWKFRWSTLEPAEGQFDWSLVDQAVDVAARAGKKSILRVYSGLTTPDWVYEAG